MVLSGVSASLSTAKIVSVTFTACEDYWPTSGKKITDIGTPDLKVVLVPRRLAAIDLFLS
jgi:hypothetical protein